ncbi:MAG: SH3 domain-containing protein, partial [Clostridiales bacterium]|nr:SH3 domain-containing protein [Clostridiales bacterium]
AKVVTSNGGAVRLRSSASTSLSNILQSVPNGASLEVIGLAGAWTQVRYGSNTGYMMSEFLQVIAAPSETPEPVEPQPPEENDNDPITEEESAYKRILRSGSTGEDVRRLQMRLSELSYTVNVNGQYDSTTVSAVRNFQSLNGLKVDGVFGSVSATTIQSPGVRNAGSNPLSYSSIRMGDKDGADGAVSKLQGRLLELGFALTVDGSYGTKTHDAIVAFQHQNGLSISGIADALTQSQIYDGSAKKNTGSTPGIDISQGQIGGPSSSSVKLLDWYTQVKPVLGGATVLVFHPGSGVSFNLKMYSLGRHADSEPKSLKDTQLMNAAFGPASWNTRIVYVKLPTGEWTLGSMHNYPHLSGSISDNGFGGHLCLHFLRDLEETKKLDPNYGMQNQLALRKAWKGMTGEEVN